MGKGLRGTTVAITNSASGERAAAAFLETELRRELGEDMVVNLMDYIKKRVDPSDKALKAKEEFARQEDWEGATPDPVVSNTLEKLKDAPNGGKVIIAGGDGTVSWGMFLIDEHFDNLPDREKPFVGIIPMGTGNDLSRSLGFGPGFVREQCCCCCPQQDIKHIIADISKAFDTILDRWEIEVFNSRGEMVKREAMNNYLSIGFDAWIAYRFDKFRRENPALCKTRSGNKLWYTRFGCQALCGSPVLKGIITMDIDGEEVPPKVLASLKNVIVTNISSFGAGMKVWKHNPKKKFTLQRVNDGKLEACGYFGSFHMGLAQGNLRSSKKIGQGSSITLKIAPDADPDIIRMQVDGEPVNLPEGGSTIKIMYHPRGSHRVLTLSSDAKCDPFLFKRRCMPVKGAGEGGGPLPVPPVVENVPGAPHPPSTKPDEYEDPPQHPQSTHPDH